VRETRPATRSPYVEPAIRPSDAADGACTTMRSISSSANRSGRAIGGLRRFGYARTAIGLNSDLPCVLVLSERATEVTERPHGD
jgi:hypothetical protein